MKKFIYSLIVITLFSCSSSKLMPQDDISSYQITKINTKKSWHIIYAKKQDSLYKIVVEKKKNNTKYCNKIEVGGFYDLELKSRRENIPVIGGVKLKPINYLDVESLAYDKEGTECYKYDKKFEICTEPQNGIFDIYYTSDLVGLCYKSSPPHD